MSDADGHEPVGGAARLATAVQNVRDAVRAGTLGTGGLPALEPLVLFSGDALSPSAGMRTELYAMPKRRLAVQYTSVGLGTTIEKLVLCQRSNISQIT